MIQIHENFKYHDSITLEFHCQNSDSIAEVITPQRGAQSLQEWSDLFSYRVNFDSHIYQNWDSGILMWLSHDTQIFQKSASIVKIQILNTPVFNCVLLNSTFAFNIEKYYIVWRSCFFTINTNSWKFQVSWFNHVRIPLSQFWFGS